MIFHKEEDLEEEISGHIPDSGADGVPTVDSKTDAN